MKFLKQFLKFHWNGFCDGKQFVCMGCKEWVDYDSKKHLGTKVEAVICRDDTPYKRKDGETVSNLYEKITFKCAKDINVPINAVILPVNAVAKVYGDYNEKLSVTCEDIQIAKSGN